MREQNQRGGKNAAFGHAQEEAKEQQLVIAARETAADSEQRPGDEQNADKFFGTPMLGKMAAGNLQGEIAPEENASDGAACWGSRRRS